MPNGETRFEEYPCLRGERLEGEVGRLKADLQRTQETISGLDKKLDNLQKQIWYMAMVIVTVLAGVEKLPLIFKALGG